MVTHTVFHYRKPFHDLVRDILDRENIDYHVTYGNPDRGECKKQDSVDLVFGKKIDNKYIYLNNPPLIWQPVINDLRKSDLIILIQENRLLVNYVIQTIPRNLRPRIAYFGHGRNFQSRNLEGRAERWKRFWATKVDWWFGYTDETRRHIESLGFPSKRITVFNNSVDTGELRQQAADVTPARRIDLLRELELSGDNIGLFVGGLYADKRLDFLIQAAIGVRRLVPDFEMIIVGGGPDLERLQALAGSYAWIKIVGPKFGAEKVALMALGQVFLMPGLVGLAVLDAAVMGLPTITTAFPWHSPEIAYIDLDVNGIVVPDWECVDTYAACVAALLTDRPRLALMQQAARAMSERYTIEAMAERFAAGVLEALA